MTLAEIKVQAMLLSDSERATLASRLLHSLPPLLDDDDDGDSEACLTYDEFKRSIERIHTKGFAIVGTGVSDKTLNILQETLFHQNRAGERCLLDHPHVQETAFRLREELTSSGYLEKDAVAIQAIAFDKTPSTNWKVAWHQDLMFPFASAVTSEDFDLPCIKDGIHYARPPESVLKQLLAVRLHLDDCDETNGPLRVSPGTHLEGILKTAEIPAHLATHGQITCLAKKGEALLMRPLTLHASSQAIEPKHRRILHLVYHCGEPISETWYRAI